ncbi:putative transcriptional regulatory protein NarL [mine drainage metagenome]|uniref:Putative transcriptional regulatory protein NarL n=1 Tax=mine drainage metagenome TaxID=410659 RepID=A0A1J5S2N7_9ZZZZ
MVGRRPINVVMAEKNPLLQTSLQRLFVGDGRFNVVGMAGDGERFLAALTRLPCDVAVIGWELPVIDGRGILQSLRHQGRAPRIVVYTGSSNADVPRLALALGAAAFCSKNEPPARLLDTVVAVAEGRMIFPFIDVTRLVSDPLGNLTPRERELLVSLSGGMTNQQMAEKAGISLNTVKFHLKNLYEKLGVGNRAQAVAFYLRSQESL